MLGRVRPRYSALVPEVVNQLTQDLAPTVMEDVESLLPRSAVAELKAKSPPPAESQIKTTQKDKGKKGKSKKITTLEELQLIEDSKSISPLYSMDAFNMGNVSSLPSDARE